MADGKEEKVMEEKGRETTRQCCNTDAPSCPYRSEDVEIIPCRALVAAFGICFALMCIWEVVTSWI